MGNEVTISIDHREIRCCGGIPVIAAADAAGIYIPRLCHYPDLPPGPGTLPSKRIYQNGPVDGEVGPNIPASYHGCDICLVEIEGIGIAQACSTLVTDGMIVATSTETVLEEREKNLARVLANHPHSCMLCSENEGCDREECTEGEERRCRCCAKFDDCELRKVCGYVGIRDDVEQYRFTDRPVVETPFFTYDANLCIGCTRCVRACSANNTTAVLGFVFSNGAAATGTLGPTHRDSHCTFCGACVAVCPTGALIEKGHSWKKKESLKLSPPILPPVIDIEATEENIGKVPETNGVFQLFDEHQEVIYIRGTENLQRDLREKVQSLTKARFFRYEEHGMYTMRENEMLEKHLRTHGVLPEVNNEISDLY
jgi:predicted molibdopterin-dependent oxidoreductase YjgC